MTARPGVRQQNFGIHCKIYTSLTAYNEKVPPLLPCANTITTVAHAPTAAKFLLLLLPADFMKNLRKRLLQCTIFWTSHVYNPDKNLLSILMGDVRT